MALISAVTEAAFVERRRADWAELEVLAQKVTRRGWRSLTPQEIARFSPLYRDIASDLSRAQVARYTGPLIDYLQGLTATTHTLMYGSHAAAIRRRERAQRALEAFPRAVRRRWRAMLLAAALFFVPMGIGVVGSLLDPEFAFRVVPESMLRPLAEAYSQGFEEPRGLGKDMLMAGFYVNNNVGIALRCFALGVLGGVLTGLYLVFNGLAIGATLGYVVTQGAGDNIVTFIMGHSSFELGAIVLAGGAGLSLGWSVISPGHDTRLLSLQTVAKDVFAIVCGAAVMLLIAAAIEGFWSGSPVSAVVKRIVGGIGLVIVASYLAFVGRGERRS